MLSTAPPDAGDKGGHPDAYRNRLPPRDRRDHWLRSDLREKRFGELGITNIRTYTDPTNPARVAISADVPDVDAFVAWLQTEDGAATAKSDGVLLDTIVLLVES